MQNYNGAEKFIETLDSHPDTLKKVRSPAHHQCCHSFKVPVPLRELV